MAKNSLMKYSGAFLLFTILLSGCANMGSNANEPLAIDFIRKNFSVKTEVTLKDPQPIVEDTLKPPVVKQVKFIEPPIIQDGDETYGEGYDGPDDNVGTVVEMHGSDELVGPMTVNEVPADENEIFSFAEVMPEFPGGETAMLNYLTKNMQYPEMAREQGIQGKVWLSFVVDKEGMIKDVKILRGIGAGCDEEAKRVVSKMPRWNPGKMNGRNVMVKCNLPINFKLY